MQPICTITYLDHASSHNTYADLRHQLDADARLRVGALEVVDELLKILNRVNVVVWRRRDQTHSGRGVAASGNRLGDLVARQLTALTYREAHVTPFSSMSMWISPFLQWMKPFHIMRPYIVFGRLQCMLIYMHTPGLAPWAILICSSSALVKYQADTPNRPDATYVTRL